MIVLRGPYYHGIVIDDSAGFVFTKLKNGKPVLSDNSLDRQAFEKAKAAYEAVGLIAHPEKAVRQQLRTTIWGG